MTLENLLLKLHELKSEFPNKKSLSLVLSITDVGFSWVRDLSMYFSMLIGLMHQSNPYYVKTPVPSFGGAKVDRPPID